LSKSNLFVQKILELQLNYNLNLAKHIILSFLLTGSVIAQPVLKNDKYTFFPDKINEPVQMDGLLDEQFWKNPNKITEFVQREPRDGDLPSEQTEVMILYDEQNIYLGIRFFDSEPDKIIYHTKDRDNFNIMEDDQFVFALDTYNDERNGYWFSTNPAGAKVDAQFNNEGNIFNENWDGIWQIETSIDSYGWTIEMAIPLSTIRFKGGEQVIMGANFMRRIVRKNEGVYFPPIPRDFANGSMTVSKAMKLEFKQLDEVYNLYALPYVLGGAEDERFISNSITDLKKDIGVDVKYSITSNLTADLTINTDFAQAEADNQQVNFSRNQLFFPEKREFFIENSGYFNYGIPYVVQPFFSRKIGIHNNEIIPIIAGVRVSGRVDDFGIGVLNMQTSKTDKVNSTNYSVARLTTDIGKRSYIGSIFTNKQNSSTYNRVIGLDINLALDVNTILEAQASRSFSSVDPGTGNFWNIHLTKQSEIFGYSLDVTSVGDQYNPEIGFVARKGVRYYEASLGYAYFIQKHYLRKIKFVPQFSYITNQSNVLESRFAAVRIEPTFESEDLLYFELNHSYENLSTPIQFLTNFTVDPGIYQFLQTTIGIESNGSRFISGYANVTFGKFYDSDLSEYSAGIKIKFSNNLNLVSGVRNSNFTQRNVNYDIQLYDATIKYTFSTELLASLLLQYNTEDKILNSNFRIEWNTQDGNRFYFVLTHNKYSPLHRRIAGDRMEAIVKYIHFIKL
jgi:hypothetical protein